MSLLIGLIHVGQYTHHGQRQKIQPYDFMSTTMDDIGL